MKKPATVGLTVSIERRVCLEVGSTALASMADCSAKRTYDGRLVIPLPPGEAVTAAQEVLPARKKARKGAVRKR